MKTKIKQQCFIGENAEIIKAYNKSLIGLKGKITDETKNTFKIGTKTVLKSQIIIKINDYIINGKKIQKIPNERIKKG